MRCVGPLPPIVITREQRFAPTAAQLRAFLEHTLGDHFTVKPWDPHKPFDYVRTTYFDTEDLVLFHSAIARRVRLREYGRASTADDTPVPDRACYLELKQANGPLTTKMRFELDREALLAPDGVVDPARAIDAARDAPPALSASLGFPLRALRPRLTTCYRRVSLGGRTGRIRVTVDHGITFSAPGPLGDNLREPENVLGDGPPRVVEVKYESVLPEWFTDALHLMPAAVQTSKFELGMRTVLAGSRSGSRYRAVVGPVPERITKG